MTIDRSVDLGVDRSHGANPLFTHVRRPAGLLAGLRS
jgi:hypothetical protein